MHCGYCGVRATLLVQSQHGRWFCLDQEACLRRKMDELQRALDDRRA